MLDHIIPGSQPHNCSKILTIDSSLNRAIVYVKVEFCNCTCGTITCEPTYTYRIVQHAFSTPCQKQINQNTYDFGSGYGRDDDDDMDYEFDYESSLWIENEDKDETPFQNNYRGISFCPIFGFSRGTSLTDTTIIPFIVLVASVLTL